MWAGALYPRLSEWWVLPQRSTTISSTSTRLRTRHNLEIVTNHPFPKLYHLGCLSAPCDPGMSQSVKSVAGICHSGAPPLAAPDRTLLVESQVLLEAFILNGFMIHYCDCRWLYIWLLIIEGVDHDDLPLASPADRPPTNQTEGGQKVWSVTIPIQVVSHHRRLPYLSSTIHCVHYCLHQIFTLFFWITSPGSCDDLESFSWREVRYLSYFLDNGNSENYVKLKGPPSKSHIHQCQQYKHFAQDTIEGALVLPITDNVSPLHQTLVQLIESGKVVSYIKYMCVTTPDFATNYNYSHVSDTLWHNTVTKFSGTVWQTYFLTIVA